MSQCCVLFLDGSLSQANISKQTKIELKSASTNFKTDGPSFSSSILLLSVRVGFQTVSGKTTAIFKRKGHLCLSESLECIQVKTTAIQAYLNQMKREMNQTPNHF